MHIGNSPNHERAVGLSTPSCALRIIRGHQLNCAPLSQASAAFPEVAVSSLSIAGCLEFGDYLLKFPLQASEFGLMGCSGGHEGYDTERIGPPDIG
jgi:hypothetical protein